MQSNEHIEYDVQQRARAGTRATLRALVAGYLAYLAWQIFQGVRTGESTMDPTVGYLASAFFLLAAVAFAVYLVRHWRLEVEAARLPESAQTEESTEDET